MKTKQFVRLFTNYTKRILAASTTQDMSDPTFPPWGFKVTSYEADRDGLAIRFELKYNVDLPPLDMTIIPRPGSDPLDAAMDVIQGASRVISASSPASLHPRDSLLAPRAIEAFKKRALNPS